MNILRFDSSSIQMEEIIDLYCLTFGGEKEEFRTRIHRHMSYPGFLGLIALTDELRLSGFTYGYISSKGQYYHSLLDSAFTPLESTYWLEDCFEYVELIVSSDFQGKGVGQQLMTSLLSLSSQKTGILTTQQNNHHARYLYSKIGWKTIKEPFFPSENSEAFVIMGKVLS